jgi:hypothetical protein
VPRFIECWHVASTPRALTSSKSEFVPESQNSVDTISVIQVEECSTLGTEGS